MSTSSSSTVISGLGISFLPSPPPPVSSNTLKGPSYGGPDRRPLQSQQQYRQERSIRHSVSHDAGLYQQNQRQQSRVMVRHDSDDSRSDHSSQRKVRIAVGTPEVFGREQQKRQQQQQAPVRIDYLGAQPHLSPLSEFDLSSSESDSGPVFSPEPVSSLPSSTNPADAFRPQSLHSLHHGHSMNALPFVDTGNTNPYSSNYTSDLAYARGPAAPSSQSSAGSSTGSSSRLPLFLRERVKKQALSRPQSMLELGEMYALQTIEDRSVVPEQIHSRHYGGGVGETELMSGAASSSTNSASNHSQSSHSQADHYSHPLKQSMLVTRRPGLEDLMDEVEELQLESFNFDQQFSPESMPSSAGGLQRRQLERQLQEQHTRHQKELRRVSQNLPPETPEKEPPSDACQTPVRQLFRSRSKSVSAGSRPRDIPEPKPAQNPAARRQSELVTMRSFASMHGLEPAETGGSFIALDSVNGKFEQGEEINPQSTSDGMQLGEEAVVTDERLDDLEGRSESQSGHSSNSVISNQTDGRLTRNSTLLTVGANPARRSKELLRILGQPSKKIPMASGLSTILGSPTPSNATSVPFSFPGIRHAPQPPTSGQGGVSAAAIPVVLEQTKGSRTRVELDLILESSLVVEGGSLRGRVEVRIRMPKDRDSDVWIGKPKVRVVGFEELASQEESRHIFYHHASSISSIESPCGPPLPLPCFDSEPDSENFHRGLPGQHVIPFSMPLPLGKGAKGGFKSKQGVVRYIVIASIKLKNEQGEDRSISHFYRHVEIYPHLNPAIILAPALKVLVATASKTLFMGGSGKVNLTAKMHRGTWVAGQRCYVDVSVDNCSSKKIKFLNLSLVRITTVFRPRPWLNSGNAHDQNGEDDVDPDACQTQTTKKKVSESTLEMGKKGAKGVATAKGSWLGVDGGENASVSHFVVVPPEELSVSRGRYLEVTYAIKVAVGGTLSADVTTEIPVRIVNFVSLDPPPGNSAESTSFQTYSLAKSWSKEQLQPGGKTRAETIRKQPVNKASLESLRLSDLNGGHGRRPISRLNSNESFRTSDLCYTQEGIAPGAELSPASTISSFGNGVTSAESKAMTGRGNDRQLVHQISLDCISSAIASATARRTQGHRRTESGLRSEVLQDEDQERWEEGEDEEDAAEDTTYFAGGGDQGYGGLAPYESQSYGEGDQSRIELDDLDDIPDEQVYYPLPVEPEVESEDELDALMDASRFEDDEDTAPTIGSLPVPSATSSSRAGPITPSRSPAFGRAPPAASAAKTHQSMGPPPVPVPRSAMKKPTESFGYATPSSPVKAKIPPPSPSRPRRSPVVAQSPRKVLGSGPPSSMAQNLPRPSGAASSSASDVPLNIIPAGRVLQKRESTSSLKRGSLLVKKMPSSRTLRPVSGDSSSDSSSRDEPYRNAPVRAPFDLSQRQRQLQPTASSLAKISPRLLSSRSTGNLRPLPVPPGARPPVPMLPSIRNKVQALESKQFARMGVNGVDDHSPGSLTESDTSFAIGDYYGMDTDEGSPKAPMLRRQLHRAI